MRKPLVACPVARDPELSSQALIGRDLGRAHASRLALVEHARAVDAGRHDSLGELDPKAQRLSDGLCALLEFVGEDRADVARTPDEVVAAAAFARDGQHRGFVEIGAETDAGREHTVGVEGLARESAELFGVGLSDVRNPVGDEHHQEDVVHRAATRRVPGGQTKRRLDVRAAAGVGARDGDASGATVSDRGGSQIEGGVFAVADEAEGVVRLQAIDELVGGGDRMPPLLSLHGAGAIEHEPDVHARARRRLALVRHQRDLQVHAFAVRQQAAALELGVEGHRFVDRNGIGKTAQLLERFESDVFTADHDAPIEQVLKASRCAAASHEGRRKHRVLRKGGPRRRSAVRDSSRCALTRPWHHRRRSEVRHLFRKRLHESRLELRCVDSDDPRLGEVGRRARFDDQLVRRAADDGDDAAQRCEREAHPALRTTSSLHDSS